MEPCNLFLAQVKEIIIFLRDHLHAWFSSVNRKIFMFAAIHFFDHSMHRPLGLCVREGILIILLIEGIIPFVRLRVVYALFGSLASLEIIPLIAPGILSTYFSIHDYYALTKSLNRHHQTEVSSLKDFSKIFTLSLISVITQQFILLAIKLTHFLLWLFLL